ncbi:hypothetical protein FACS1894176_04160 [Bacteroidia bacterium]|nr:hypothetical protein FACS1894176_04160 [Bacteroidia bacterium]
MKKIITSLVFLLFVGIELLAYDYQAIYSNQTAIFDGGTLQGMKIDSVKVLENDSVFYPLKRILHDGSYCYTPYGASWLGEKIIISANWNNFINKNDTIRIKTDAVLGESWIVDEGLISKMVAKVTSHKIESFLGLEDSVKTISFQAYDLNNVPIDRNLMNNKTLKISKNYGIIQGFDFLPQIQPVLHNIYQEYTLAGLSNPKAGIQNITWFDIWDFQPGDELHIYEREISCIIRLKPTHRNRKKPC